MVDVALGVFLIFRTPIWTTREKRIPENFKENTIFRKEVNNVRKWKEPMCCSWKIGGEIIKKKSYGKDSRMR